MTRLELYYDYSCPFAYLASTQVVALAQRTGATLEYKPFLLGGVFRALGPGAGEMSKLPPVRARMNALDMHRWAEHWGVPLQMPSGHPNRTVLALRATLACDDVGRASHALFQAYWAEGRDLSDPAVVAATLDRAGLDGATLVRRAEEQSIKDELRSRTDEAIARGVFGAPACFVHGQLYWGQDRLDFVERALGREPDAWRLPPRDAKSPAPRLDFWFDFSSPFAYLASTRVEAVAARAGAELRYRPFLLGALFKAVGTANVPLLSFSEAKQRYYRAEMDRFARHYGVPFRFPSQFPIRSVLPLRVALAADRPELVQRFFRAAWAEDANLESPQTLRALCREVGVDSSLVDAATSDDAKLALRRATDEAVELGLCGAPSFVVDGLLFWGQDRLPFVEKALAGWRPRVG